MHYLGHSSHMAVEIDAIDRRILAELQRDGTLSADQMSERVGLSRNACWRRVRILEEAGVYRMSGDLDYVLRARVADVKAYDRLYQRLIARVPLADVSASFVMEEIKETTVVPVELR